jgi:reactive intermediate/imine deaminase
MTKKQVFGTSHVPLSPAVRAGDMVYVSGQVPVRSDGSMESGNIEAQTRQVLENIKAALALAGATMEQVVKTTVWIEDARDFGGMNKVYATFFPSEPPARTTVESRLMADIKVEIEAVAYAPVK